MSSSSDLRRLTAGRGGFNLVEGVRSKRDGEADWDEVGNALVLAGEGVECSRRGGGRFFGASNGGGGGGIDVCPGPGVVEFRDRGAAIGRIVGGLVRAV
jgi:hypothetical protein